MKPNIPDTALLITRNGEHNLYVTPTESTTTHTPLNHLPCWWDAGKYCQHSFLIHSRLCFNRIQLLLGNTHVGILLTNARDQPHPRA